jgi:hypothetical protein
MKIPDDAAYARYQKSYEKMIDFTGRMYKAGIPLVAGPTPSPASRYSVKWNLRAGASRRHRCYRYDLQRPEVRAVSIAASSCRASAPT